MLLIRMVGETAHHTGHADIVRELIDGRVGDGNSSADKDFWREQKRLVEAAAAHFRDR